MNHGPLVFLVAFFALAASWFGFVLTPQMQIGQLEQTNTIPAGETYPVARPGLAHEGLEVYRANGCACCHSQQIGQTGTVCDVFVNEAGTNQALVVAGLLKVKEGWKEAQAKDWLTKLPNRLLEGVTKPEADAAVKALNVGGAKPELWIVPVGPDISRGWGKRRTVAEDYLFDSPVMPGSQRVGPDLANIGLRQPDANWQLCHLYAPRSEVTNSVMAPYPFLFEKRRIDRTPSLDALKFPAGSWYEPEAGYEIVPKLEARQLVAYLGSLRADAPLFDAPLTIPPAAPSPTNAAPAQATNAVAANVPAK
jgi:cbb3-type cytochrome oxidase cytochrome c subunit